MIVLLRWEHSFDAQCVEKNVKKGTYLNSWSGQTLYNYRIFSIKWRIKNQNRNLNLGAASYVQSTYATYLEDLLIYLELVICY